MSNTSDFRIKVGAYTGYDKSPIYKDIKTIKENINKNPPKITLDVNKVETAKNFKIKLNEIISNIKLDDIKLNFEISNIEKSISNSVKKGIENGANRAKNKVKDDILSYANVNEIQKLNKLYVKDRSKTDPIKNIVEQLKGDPNVKSVSVAGKSYFEKDKQQLKSFTTAIKYTNGEVKKLEFGIAQIGKTRGFVQLDTSKFKSSVNTIVADIENLKNRIKSVSMESLKLHEETISSKVTKIGKLDEDKLKEYANFLQLNTQLQQSIKNPSIQSEKDYKTMKGILDDYDNSYKKINLMTSSQLKYNKAMERTSKLQRDTQNFISNLDNFKKLNDKMLDNSNSANKFEEIYNKTVGMRDSGIFSETELNQAKTELGKLKEHLVSTGMDGQKAITKLNAQFQKLGVYITASTVMFGAFNVIKQMTRNVVELDSAMTELKKVTDETDNVYSKFLDNAEIRAKRLGATLTDTVRATAD